MSDFAANVTAIGVLITAIGTYVNGRRIKEVKHEVKTGNSQTLAQLTDAVETRRIDKILPADRTTLEKSHLREAK